jgi:cobalt-zinc-cadmium efflux system membrane fusion protein
MNKKQLISLAIVLALGAGLTVLALKNKGPLSHAHDEHSHDHGAHESPDAPAAAEFERGPHQGRMLREDDFATEVTIFERGVPPQFRVYCYEKGEPVDPAQVKLTIQLDRLGGRTDVHQFKPEGEYLAGDLALVVYEPHSFNVTVTAERGGKTHRWQYNSPEARVELSPEAAKNSGVIVETVSPATIKSTLKVNGRIRVNEEQMKHVVPRYPGVLKEVRKKLGDPVAKDEVLAVVESNESLQRYEVKSDLAGTIIEKHAMPGEFVDASKPMFVVADLGSVWVDLNIFRQDAPRVKAGQTVMIDGGDGLPKAAGKITYLSPFGAESTQTLLARVVLPNPAGEWRPGLFVTGAVIFAEAAVPVAVKPGALQSFRDWTVVFVNEGNLYEPIVVETGRRDADWVEIVSGMKVGQRYVAAGSFIIKADILKSGASHDH